jgi:hypothetical protein
MKANYKIIIGAFTALVSILLVGVSYAGLQARIRYADNMGYAQNYTFFTATTTTATSTNYSDGNDSGLFIIAGAKKVEFYFTHGGSATSSTGTSTFSVQVSPDGLNWFAYPKLVTGTSSAVIAQVQIQGATSTVNANLSTILTDAFYAVRCIVNEGTNTGASGDGEHTCKAYAEY